MFEVFEHTADLGLRIRASSLDQLFAEAGRGLFSLIVADVSTVRATQGKQFRVTGNEVDYLMFDWLSELLYAFDSSHLLLCEFRVRMDAKGLTADCLGEPVDPDRHLLEHEVKAITYHQFLVEERDGQWLAEFVVDI